jgi:hypothetical protein
VANFVYGDSCVSGDDKYVIAQFRQDDPMEWVADLRAFLVQDELKYKTFQPHRHWVQSNKPLWRRVKDGIERAEITIVDPSVYEQIVRFDLEDAGAEYGGDFDDRIVSELTSNALIEDSPLRIAQISEADWLTSNPSDEPLPHFSTSTIRRRIGGKRRDVVVTAARAHAMISPSEKWELMALCTNYAMPNLVERMAMIKKLARVFDVEHPKSADLLNDFTMRVSAVALSPLGALPGSGPLVREESSKNIDHIQGADIAAGWAVDTLMLTNDYVALARQFAVVCVNGLVIPG